MFSFLLPKHVRQGRNLLKDATKLLAYKRDLWSDATVLEYKSRLRRLEDALRQRDRAGIEENARELDRICSANLPPLKDAAMRENVEVFLVAIVIALGVRTYFLQPFTIPTGSMQPTLNGILAYPTTEPPPNPLVRLFHTAALGRAYVNVVAKEDCTVSGAREFKSLLPFIDRTPLLGDKLGIFTRTEIITTSGSGSAAAMRRHVVHAEAQPVTRYLLQPVGSTVRAGEPIARGYIDTGDHVFVDKMSYHFRNPQRGDVFVFNTQDVPTGENARHPQGMLQFALHGAGPFAIRGPVDPTRGSQFYIKRLAGTPGDELRIDPPRLFINGQLAGDPCFRRVMGGTIKAPTDGYQGYSNGPEGGRFSILGDPEIPYSVPPKNYFALGDNSYHSSDSRDWGSVPQRNLMGRGVLVYWPFARHWGLIR